MHVFVQIQDAGMSIPDSCTARKRSARIGAASAPECSQKPGLCLQEAVRPRLRLCPRTKRRKTQLLGGTIVRTTAVVTTDD